MEYLDTGTILVAIGSLAAVLFIIFSVSSVLSFVRKVPSNQARLVFGVGCKTAIKVSKQVKVGDRYEAREETVFLNFRIVKGGMALVFPVIQETKTLDLRVFEQDINVVEVLSNNAVPVNVDGIAQLAIGDEDALIATAARLHLDKKPEQILSSAKETLQGHLRSIIGQLCVEDLYQDREAFARKVQEVASDDMAGLGIKIVSFVIKELNDSKGYLEALGRPRIAEVKKEARVKSAEAEQEAVEKEQAADKKKAEFTKETRVAKAQYEVEVAEQEAKAERALAIGLAEQDKNLEEKRTAAAEVAAGRREKELDAEVRRPADADKYKIEQEAKAKRFSTEQTAEADLVTAQKKAEAAKAAADGTRATLVAEADGTRAKLTAEADGTRAKLMAEADGTRAKLMAEADGKKELAASLNSYGDSALRQVLGLALLEGIPSVAESFGKAFANIEQIRLVEIGSGSEKDGKGAVERFLDVLPNTLFKFLQGAAALLGTPIDDFAVSLITQEAAKRGVTIPAEKQAALKEEVARRAKEAESSGDDQKPTEDKAGSAAETKEPTEKGAGTSEPPSSDSSSNETLQRERSDSKRIRPSKS